MKKIGIIIAVFALVLCSNAVYAQEDNVKYSFEKMEESDYLDIQNNTELILNDLEAVIDAEKLDINMSNKFVIQDFIKVYIDEDFLKLQTDSYNDIMNVLNTSNYVYVCLVEIDGVRFEITLGKGATVTSDIMEILSETELKEVREKEGKWCVSSISVLDENVLSYPEEVAMKDFSGYDDIVIAGSLSGFTYPVAVGFDNQTAKSIIPLMEIQLYDISNHISQTTKTNQAVLDFDTVKEIVKNNYNHEPNGSQVLSGGGGSSTESDTHYFPIVISVCGVVIIVLYAMYLYINSKQTRK